MKRLTANWGLKLASILFAAIVWFLVTNINDPVTSVRYTNIPVALKNTNLITDQGQVYSILDDSANISSVTIYAPRTVIDSLSQNNIVAYADFQDLSSLNTVTINVSTNKYSDKIENIVLSSDVVKLSIERKATKSLVLSATTSGNLADGYMIGDISTEQNMLRISGPESVINTIESAVVDVDVTGFTSNIGTDADIILLDADGNQVSTAQIEMNIKTVRVNVVIYETKYVPVNYVVQGEPASGYAMTGQIDSTPSEVLIAGRSSVISSVSEITVDDSALDVSGMSSNYSATVDISKYLPSGVSFGDKDFNGVCTVVVHIDNVEEETFDVDIDRISVEGEVDGFKISVDDTEYDTVSLTLQGLSDDIKKVKESDIKGTVDVDSIVKQNNLDELKPGTYSAEVTWELPNGVTAKSKVSVYVTVEEK
ncbi:YbbR-like domain-containing protein [Butyrivibrio proteoclasticus]|uniref:CdaR family protein n=1 Tax=Butyrivibrio proteoclasticus TaxID=43305 RepID=UPI00047E1335|nr:CdaR family protein [Butyrivibrio proteoclasticus]